MPFDDNDTWRDGQHESLPADEVIATSPGFWAIVVTGFDIIEPPWNYATSQALHDLDDNYNYNV